MMLKKILGIGAAMLAFAAFVPGLHAQTVLLDEDFDGSWSTTSPPSGWTIVYNSPANNSDWHNGNWGFSNSASGVADMYYSPDPWSYQTDDYISPTVDCSDYDEVWIAFEHEYNHYSGFYDNMILGSTDGGSSWTDTILDYNQSSYARIRDSFDISSWAGGESEVAFNWHCYGPPWNMNYRAFDEVKVYGFEPDTGGGGEEIDLEMSQIVRPKDMEEAGVAFKPECKVYNNTDDVVEAEVRCKFKNRETQQTVYEDVLGSVPLDPGYNDVKGFKNFTPEAGVKYYALFVVSHPDDVNPDNDTKDKNWGTAGADVTPTEMYAPSADQYNAFDPSAKFVEGLGQDVPGVWLHYKIEDGAYHAVVSEDSLEHDFTADEEYTATFPTVSGLDDGAYTITFWATDDRGSDISNPPLIENFNYTGIVETPVAERFSLEAVGTRVSFSLGVAAVVSVRVYDVAGNVVARPVSGFRTAGSYSLDWRAEDTGPGIYFVKLTTPEFSAVRKVLVLH